MDHAFKESVMKREYLIMLANEFSVFAGAQAFNVAGGTADDVAHLLEMDEAKIDEVISQFQKMLLVLQQTYMPYSKFKTTALGIAED
jgi:hypothetical protein